MGYYTHGYRLVSCEACHYRKALEEIAGTYPYQVHSAVQIAKVALRSADGRQP